MLKFYLKLYLYKYLIRFIPDSVWLKLRFRKKMGYSLNLKNPKTFNEKLQWLKLYDRNPLYTKLVDKYEVRKYVAERIGEKYLIPLLGVWDKFEDIDFDKLPNQFVLKCTHDSGGLVICKDKSKLDMKTTKRKITRCLKLNYYWALREWPYKNVRPRIIAEKYMEDSDDRELRDYKFFCFSGIAKLLFIAANRGNIDKETTFDFFDMDFKHIEVTNGHPSADTLPHKPQTFEKMKELTEKLAGNIPHVQCDFYEVNGKTYFGEMTFAHWSGFTPFNLQENDFEFGRWIEISKIRGGGYIFVTSGFCLYIHQKQDCCLTDYKFFCFRGQPKIMYISKDKAEYPTTDFFDMEYRHLNLKMRDPNSRTLPSKPQNFELMKSLAAKMSKGFPHVRVDFFDVNGRIYMGEMTFYHCSGFAPIQPMEWERKLGDMLYVWGKC